MKNMISIMKINFAKRILILTFSALALTLPVTVLFCGPTANANPGSEAAEAKILKSLKKLIEYTGKKQIPMQIPEKYYSKLNISTPVCNDSDLNQKMAGCTYFKCFKKRNVGDAIMYSEVIIHGFNTQKNCAVSYKDLRYYIPASDLASFIPQFDVSSNLHTEALSAFHSNSGKKNPVEILVSVPSQNSICKIKATYQIDLDIKNAVVSKTPPARKPVGIEKVEANNSTESYYEFNKVIYSPKHRAFNFIPKLLSYELDSSSSKTCKDNKAALLSFELEKRGFVNDTSGL